MNRIGKVFNEYRLVLLIIGLFLSVVLYRAHDKYKFNRLKNNGIRTIAYVYENKPEGRSTGCSAQYYFFYNNAKYYDYRSTKYVCNLDNKFCIVYYKKNNHKINSLDFNAIVCPDSVYKYFPLGENPFLKEVIKVKQINGNKLVQ